MASSLYLEHYLDSIESLPLELQRNFSLLRELDQRAHDMLQDVDKLSADYLSTVKHLSTDDKKDYFQKIENAFQKSREYGDDKVQLAVQTYEMVDKHIRKLDSDLARFEEELKHQQGIDISGSSDMIKPEPIGKTKKRKSDKIDGVKSSKKNKKKKEQEELLPLAQLSATPLLTMATDMNVLDMPVDPNEPTYCLCHQVSYGEMIGCDNLECPIEWFHFGCVGLIAKPKGKWYCPKCAQDRKKK